MESGVGGAKVSSTTKTSTLIFFKVFTKLLNSISAFSWIEVLLIPQGGVLQFQGYSETLQV